MLARAIGRYRGIIFYRGTPSSTLRLSHGDLAALDAHRADYAARPRGAGPRGSVPPAPAFAGRWSSGGDSGSGGSGPATMPLAGLEIKVTGPAALSVGVDESYTLDISNTSAVITAQNQWGALRGLETFAQTVFCLTASSPSSSLPSARVHAKAGGDDRAAAGCVYAIQNLPLHIADKPRFAHRGIMIDTSRHFIGLAGILRAIDAMSYTKLNVLHWHATDDNSWSLASTRYPNFTLHGAYSPDQVYSAADFAMVKDCESERSDQYTQYAMHPLAPRSRFPRSLARPIDGTNH